MDPKKNISFFVDVLSKSFNFLKLKFIIGEHMKRFFLPLMAAGFALGLFAGTGSQIGTATEKAPPEFVTVNLWVKSQCYGSPIEAKTDNDPVIKEVQNLLSQFITKGSVVDKIYFDGGLTSSYHHEVYENGQTKILCPNTWQKISKVTLVTENIKDFGDNWDIIQTEALKKFKVHNSSTLSESATTFVTIENPTADVCEKKRAEMQEKAIQKATQNAHKKFWACVSQCGVPRNKIQFTRTNLPNQVDSYNNAPEKFLRAAPGNGAPMISFHEVTETASVELSYIFPDTDFENCTCH